MVLKIRLRQQGRANRQTYRLVVTDIRNPRDGKYLEMLGWYNPFSPHAESEAKMDIERIRYWVELGAQITPVASALLARIAPEAMSQMNANKQAARVKKAAKRRALRKG